MYTTHTQQFQCFGSPIERIPLNMDCPDAPMKSNFRQCLQTLLNESELRTVQVSEEVQEVQGMDYLTPPASPRREPVCPGAPKKKSRTL